jgi:hypothetical protein
MSPPCNAFTAEQLPSFVQANVNGKKRKVEGGGNVDLLKCPLREFSQYRCRVENPRDPNCPVRCKTVVRFFREYVENPLISLAASSWTRLFVAGQSC